MNWCLPYVVWSSLYLYAFPSLQRMPYETLQDLKESSQW